MWLVSFPFTGQTWAQATTSPSPTASPTTITPEATASPSPSPTTSPSVAPTPTAPTSSDVVTLTKEQKEALDKLLAPAPSASPINSGDTAFMLVAAALVLLMTPGLAFFLRRFSQNPQRVEHNDDELIAHGCCWCYLGFVGL